ncbi:MAG: iron-containing alcohol dehydrogenase [Firmicutes bacterium]|nr:iron-containing alcohol dehydrogenase [Bacillota bacterium]
MLPTIQRFQLRTKIVFGMESLRELPNEAEHLGKNVLVVTGKHSVIENGVLQRVNILLRGSGFAPVFFSEIEPEPSLETVAKGLAMARSEEADWVIGLGGGSAMDAAKAIAGLYRCGREVEYYFNGGPIEAEGIPLIAIPTTAGSGAEVTFNAVLTDGRNRIKKSIRDPRLAAKTCIVDPQLTFSAPETVTVYAGADALVQAIEAYVSKGANFLTDIYALAAVEKLGNNLLKTKQDGNNIEARIEMSMGSLMAGIALSVARLGAVHGLAHSIGVRAGKPHGLVCAVLLVPVMRFNLAVCHEKYARIAAAMGAGPVRGDSIDAGAMAIKNIMNLLRKLNIPAHISDLGIKETDFPEIIEESLESGSMKANPREVTADDLLNILHERV